jgi:hypothetical protein
MATATRFVMKPIVFLGDLGQVRSEKKNNLCTWALNRDCRPDLGWDLRMQGQESIIRKLEAPFKFLSVLPRRVDATAVMSLSFQGSQSGVAGASARDARTYPPRIRYA